MLAQPKNVLITIGVLMLAVSACQGLPSAPTPGETGPDYPSTLTAIAQTLSAGTAPVSATVEIASATSSTEGVPTGTPLIPSTGATTEAAPTLTATFTVTPSPGVPMVSVTTGTNCRSGPGQMYELLGGAQPGTRFVLVGKSTSTNYWIIRLPNGPECWLWGQYAAVEGNVNSLPEYAIPPTPLPRFGSIVGTVRDSLGNPVPNASVSALVAKKSFTTGSNGTFLFQDLRAGTEFISVSAPSFEAASRSVNVSPGSTSTADIVMVPVGPTGTPPPPSPTPPAQAIVQGVVMINGLPAVGATVSILGTPIQTFTDNYGRYGFSLSPGSYRILAELGNARGAIELSLPENQTTTAPNIILSPR